MGSQWQVERKHDPYYKSAKKENYRSRASYKLLQLNKKYKLIKEGYSVVDLGAAPGGWSQVALERVGETGTVVGVDLNNMRGFKDYPNFVKVRGDFTDSEVQNKIIDSMDGKANALISDAAPKLTGIRDIDQLNSYELVYTVLDLRSVLLKEHGNMLIKIFQGPEFNDVVKSIKNDFKIVKTTKPASSRKKSSEMYLMGLNYRPSKKR